MFAQRRTKALSAHHRDTEVEEAGETRHFENCDEVNSFRSSFFIRPHTKSFRPRVFDVIVRSEWHTASKHGLRDIDSAMVGCSNSMHARM